MAFTVKFESPEIITILKSLESMCSVLPLEFSADGLGLNVVDDNKFMAFSIFFDESMLLDYNFEGDGVERITLSSKNFKDVVTKMAYPIEMTSIMDTGIKLASTTGRQSYTIKAVERDYAGTSEKVQEQLEMLANDEDSCIIIKTMHQDLKQALRNVAVADNSVKISLDGDRLELFADSIDIDAEAFVPLVEDIDGEWEKTYNVKYFLDILGVLNTNREITMRLFEDARSFIASVQLGSEGDGFCRLTLAPVTASRVEREEETDAEDDDEPDDE